MDRRQLIKKFGLLATAAYVVPAVVGISKAQASSGSGSTGSSGTSGTSGSTDGSGSVTSGTSSVTSGTRDLKSTRLNSSHVSESRMPSSA